jgi:cytochrome c peroxidase
MKTKHIFYFLSIALFLSCTKDKMPSSLELDNQLRQNIRAASPDGSIEYYILPNETDLANIPQDPKNPLTPAKVALGNMLYFETGLATEAKKPSGIGTYSCSTCHVAEAGFKPGLYQGVADGGIGYGVFGENRIRNSADYTEADLDVQSARPLTMVNVGYVEATMWNGSFGPGGVNEGTEDQWVAADGTINNFLGFKGIEAQNMEGVHTHRMQCDEESLANLGYKEIFDEVFSDIPVPKRYTIETASLAMSAYIRTILANRAPFQKWLKGDAYAMNYSEIKGGILFFGKAQCYQCHYEPNLGSTEFHALGVKDMFQRGSFNAFPTDPRNLGRGGFTKKVEDNYKFKVPGIYNAAETKFYFHGASANSLRDLVEYKNKALTENPNVSQDLISSKFKPLALTGEEKEQLLDFITFSLNDPDLIRYKPDNILSGNCFPNNDAISQMDLGCN